LDIVDIVRRSDIYDILDIVDIAQRPDIHDILDIVDITQLLDIHDIHHVAAAWPPRPRPASPIMVWS
jgi:hypothetical protein